jgi:hypothetical protein
MKGYYMSFKVKGANECSADKTRLREAAERHGWTYLENTTIRNHDVVPHGTKFDVVLKNPNLHGKKYDIGINLTTKEVQLEGKTGTKTVALSDFVYDKWDHSIEAEFGDGLYKLAVECGVSAIQSSESDSFLRDMDFGEYWEEFVQEASDGSFTYVGAPDLMEEEAA